MPALPPILVIARLTVQEASRRRLLLALVILTLIVVGISAWGFYKITTVTGPSGKPPSHEEVIIVSSQLLIFVTFVYSGVLALSAAVVAGPLISNEVESGLILSILARPVRRSEIVIGKWLGLAILVTIYAVGSATLEMIAVDWATTYLPPHPVELIVYVGLEGLALLSLGLLLSTRLSGITGGVIALVAWLMAWLGGINAMEPDVILAQLRSAGAFARANPFAALDPPPVAFLLWVAVWFSLTLFLSIWSFRTREI